jgi:tRNA A-37 threonylcarbamoyl transferase component Bud32/tetratricopeptide (TPR) repeat protein
VELVGRTFGNIRVTESIGFGGMGNVYAGFDTKLQRKVAIKALHDEYRLDNDARERLLREARALSKLDHPNICRIYDYIATDSLDLLVLEYIEGQTLDAVLASGLPLTRAERLRIAESIAGALAAAHRAGIIHRDIKPDNVMLARSGEVKVLDFGLARWHGAAGRRISERLSLQAVANGAASEATLALRAVDLDSHDSGKPFLKTTFGVALGTPIYMSPEQARGERVTAASDMYSFGLLLQTLFTGRELFPEGLTAREVIGRAARGETAALDGDLPSDVAKLVTALKRFAPADRPTANEAVQRLRHMAARSQRLVQRAIAAAIALFVLAGAWRYTVDLRRERAEAQRRRAQADELIEFMLVDLRKKLEPVGRLDIMNDVAARAIRYVDALDPERAQPVELARAAKAVTQLGEVRLAQGRHAEAVQLFTRALELGRAAIRRDPQHAEGQLAYGTAHFWLGNARHERSDYEGALQHMREYQRVGESLAEREPMKREYQLERAYGHGNVAHMLERLGRPEQALEHHWKALRIKEALARSAPGDYDAQAELAVAWNKVGVAQYRLGQLVPGQESFRKENEILRALQSRDPMNARQKARLATNLSYLARSLADLGRFDEAARYWEEEHATSSELAVRDPANVNWQRSAAVSARWLASARTRQGKRDEALALVEEARTRIAAVRRASARPSFVLDAVSIDAEYARMLAERGDQPRALKIMREVIGAIGALGTNDRATRLTRGRVWLGYGDLLAGSDRSAAAAAWKRAEQEIAPAIEGSRDPQELSLWCRVLIRVERVDDARRVVAAIGRTGADTSELQRTLS